MDLYHVECNDIFEGDFAGLVFLDEDLVDANGRRAGWEAENKGVLFCWVEGFDSVFAGVLALGAKMRGAQDLPMMYLAMYDDACVGSSLMMSLILEALTVLFC